MAVSLPGKTMSGRGSVKADVSELHGQLDDVPLDQVFETKGNEIVDILGSSPGMLRTDYESGEARPDVGNAWNASAVIQIGLTINESAIVRFSIGALTEKGESSADQPSFCRYVYQGAYLNYASLMTDFPEEKAVQLRRDRLSGTFRGRRIDLRNLSDDRSAPRSFLAVIIEGPELSDLESTVLWMLVCYMNGARVKPIYMDRFDADAKLMDRRFKLGVPFGVERNAPFDYRTAQPAASSIEVLLDGFYAMQSSDFPIAMVLHHLHDANTNNVETDTIQLLFAIHTAFEAWARLNRKEFLVSNDAWTKRMPAMLESLSPLVSDVPESLRASIANKLRGANMTSMGFRERYLFESLGIELDKDDKAALNLRNTLFHNGYLRKRFGELDQAERQKRVDVSGRLRNLVNLIILKLIGYDGYVEEATRHGNLRVTITNATPFSKGR